MRFCSPCHANSRVCYLSSHRFTRYRRPSSGERAFGYSLPPARATAPTANQADARRVLSLPRPAAPFLPRRQKPPFGLALALPERRSLIGRFESSPRVSIGGALLRRRAASSNAACPPLREPGDILAAGSGLRGGCSGAGRWRPAGRVG